MLEPFKDYKYNKCEIYALHKSDAVPCCDAYGTYASLLLKFMPAAL